MPGLTHHTVLEPACGVGPRAVLYLALQLWSNPMHQPGLVCRLLMGQERDGERVVLIAMVPGQPQYQGATVDGETSLVLVLFSSLQELPQADFLYSCAVGLYSINSMC